MAKYTKKAKILKTKLNSGFSKATKELYFGVQSILAMFVYTLDRGILNIILSWEI